jgi:hypothetical protein
MNTFPNLSPEMNAALNRVQLPPSSIEKVNMVQDGGDEDQEMTLVAHAKMSQARDRVAHAQADVTRLEAADRDGALYKERIVPEPSGQTDARDRT